MRIVIAGLVSILVLAGAILAGAHFLLPDSLTIARSVDISRPQATVYTVVSNLRAWREWTPQPGVDAAAQVTFEGPDMGKGQKLLWGAGEGGARNAITIVEAVPFTRVRADTLIDRREGRQVWDVAATSAATARVTWTAHLPTGAMPWEKISAFFGRGAAEAAHDAALERLRLLVEALPAENFSDLRVEFTTLPARPFLHVEDEAGADPREVQARFAQALMLVQAAMGLNGLVPDGPAILVIREARADATVFAAGFAFAGPVPARAPVAMKLATTPEGRMLRSTHVGPPEEAGATIARMKAFLAASRVVRTGEPIMVMLDPPTADPAARRTDIFLPVG